MKKILLIFIFSFLLVLPFGFTNKAQAAADSYFESTMPNDGNQYFIEFLQTYTGGNYRLLYTSPNPFKIYVSGGSSYCLKNKDTSGNYTLACTLRNMPTTFKAYCKNTLNGVTNVVTNLSNPCYSSHTGTDYKQNITPLNLVKMKNHALVDYQYCIEGSGNPCVINTYEISGTETTQTNGSLDISTNEKEKNYPNPPVSPFGYEVGGDFGGYKIHYQNNYGVYFLSCKTNILYNSTTKKLICTDNFFSLYEYDTPNNKWVDIGQVTKNLSNLNYNSVDQKYLDLYACSHIIWQNSDIYDESDTILKCPKNQNGTALPRGTITAEDNCDWTDIFCNLRQAILPDDTYMENWKNEINTAWTTKVQLDTTSFDFLKNAISAEAVIAPLEISYINPISHVQETSTIADLHQYKDDLGFIRVITTSVLAVLTIFLIYGTFTKATEKQ